MYKKKTQIEKEKRNNKYRKKIKMNKLTDKQINKQQKYKQINTNTHRHTNTTTHTCKKGIRSNTHDDLHTN